MNKGEARFQELLIEKGVLFFPKPNIRLGVGRIQPDLFLVDYGVYCEVISHHAPDNFRRDMIKLAFERGYRITYYHEGGQKHSFMPKILKEMGLNSNSQLFAIPELHCNTALLLKMYHKNIFTSEKLIRMFEIPPIFFAKVIAADKRHSEEEIQEATKGM